MFFFFSRRRRHTRWCGDWSLDVCSSDLVEAWSMVVPWVGFPLGDLLKRFKPTSKAKFVEFKTLYDPKQMPGQRSSVLEWPYVEGLRMDEAMHPLTLMAVGLYRKGLPDQNGAPLPLIVPLKYGVQRLQSLVR